MPDIRLVNLNKTISVGYGGNLRGALLANGLTPHKGLAQYANCHGMGTCTTCKVKVLRGDVSEKSPQELFHPLRPKGDDERLACQVRVYGNVEVDTLGDPELPEEAEAEAETAAV